MPQPGFSSLSMSFFAVILSSLSMTSFFRHFYWPEDSRHGQEGRRCLMWGRPYRPGMPLQAGGAPSTAKGAPLLAEGAPLSVGGVPLYRLEGRRHGPEERRDWT